MFIRILNFSITLCFFLATLGPICPITCSAEEEVVLPAPGVMVHLSPEFTPAYLKGIVIHPENALKFDFIIYKGDKALTDAQKREEYTKLTKYFLASLAIPDDDQWVNLSPYEKGRIIKDDFGKTEMGQDLLAQDYMLKQITASLIYPQDNLGKKFWDRVYAQAQEQFGTANIPVNTFNKVWILPDDALIYEKGNTAYVLKNHLRVMLEEDYLSLKKHSGIQRVPADNKTHTIASKIVKEIVLPELEREVNEDQNFATVRQVYSGMLLAAWYKRALKESFLSKIYANKAKVKGVDQDPKNNEQIYRQYLKAYKKGVFNYIKEESFLGLDGKKQGIITRKYFSGGVVGFGHIVGTGVLYDQVVHEQKDLTPDQNAAMTGEEGEDEVAELNLREEAGTRSNNINPNEKAPEHIGAILKQINNELRQKPMKDEVLNFLIGHRGKVTDKAMTEEEIKIFGVLKGIDKEQVEGFANSIEFNNDEEKNEFISLVSFAHYLSDKKKESAIALLTSRGYYYNELQRNADELVKKLQPSIPKSEASKLKPIIRSSLCAAISMLILAMISKPDLKAMGIKESVELGIGSFITLVSFFYYFQRPKSNMSIDKDKAMATIPSMVYGGIDFNAAHLKMQIKRDGNAVPLPYAQQDMAQITQIEGLEPILLSIKPAKQTQLFSQLLSSP